MASLGFHVPHRPRTARSAPGGYRALASAGAALSVAAAVAWDLGGVEHPTHTAGLVLVTAVVLLLRTRMSAPGAGSARRRPRSP